MDALLFFVPFATFLISLTTPTYLYQHGWLSPTLSTLAGVPTAPRGIAINKLISLLVCKYAKPWQRAHSTAVVAVELELVSLSRFVLLQIYVLPEPGFLPALGVCGKDVLSALHVAV